MIDEHYHELMKVPVAEWREMLNEWSLDEFHGIKQNEPLEDYYKELAERNWTLNKPQMKQLSEGRLPSMKDVFDSVQLRPDNFQYAVATYAVESLKKHKMQLWSLPGGTGKSRTMASAGLYALLKEKVPTVHFVFHTKHMMARD